MLRQLSIRDIVLIERLDIEFESGLSVLTGETGAGKSILLDSLALALGARGDGSLVRNGADSGSVTAVFEPQAGHPVHKLLLDQQMSVADTLILRRVQNVDGKTRAFVNDEPVSVGLMRGIGTLLVELHGQHDERAMLDPSSHRELLDAHGGLETDCKLVAEAWKSWKEAEKGRDEFAREMNEAQREAEYLKSSCEELEKLSPEPGEEEKLADRRQRMMKIEQIASDLAEANETLSGNGSPVTVISNLARRLERKKGHAPELIEGIVTSLDDALNSLHDAQAALESAYNETQFDPMELEQAEERLFALRAASRKYSTPIESLPELAVKMANSLSMLEDGSKRLIELEKECEEREGEYFKLAGDLSEKRKEAGDQLSQAVMLELPALKLEAAEFMVESSSDRSQAGAHGLDTLEFWVRTNPGTKPGPMRKVASGGELARFMLALKVALTDRASAPTLVFDEIDSGVGGAVADAIGKRLLRLAGGLQVLSVTHAPQVAARASGHYLISKEKISGGERVTTAVVAISDNSRLEEIARMLSGASVTSEARAQAEKLINQPAV